MNPADVPIPQRMRNLDRDARGYPIPAGVFRDSEGKPHFTINDEEIRQRQIAEDRCPICGTRIIGGRWFAGGPLSALHDNGAYIDLPMHDECMRYAMRVCPYLAAPRYGGRIEARTIKTSDTTSRVFIDNTMLSDRPELFVCVLALSQKTRKDGAYLIPTRPYLRIEFWRHGIQLSQNEGTALCEKALAAPLPALRSPGRLVRVR